MPDPDERFARTFFVVQADSYAQHQLWLDHATEAADIYATRYRRPRLSWVDDNSGTLVTVGKIRANPVNLSCRWTTIGGRLILFCDAVSLVVHWGMIDDWLKAHCNPTRDGGKRRAHCDAMNFHHCLDAIDEANDTGN